MTRYILAAALALVASPALAKTEKRIPGETFLSPPAKIRGFIARSGIGKLAGLKGPQMISAPPLAAARQRALAQTSRRRRHSARDPARC